MAIQRNAPCPCGSGKKYKHCCLREGGIRANKSWKNATLLAAVAIGLGILLSLMTSLEVGGLVGVLGLAGVGLYLWLSEPPSSRGGGDPGAIRFGS